MVDSPAWHLVQALDTLVSADGNTITIDNYPKAATDQRGRESDDRGGREAAERSAGQEATQRRSIGSTTCRGNRPTNGSYRSRRSTSKVWSAVIPGRGKTILPHQAVAKLDLRLVPDMKAADALAALKAHLAKRGFGDIEVNMTGGYDPTSTSADSALIKAQIAVYKQRRDRSALLAAQCRIVPRLCVYRRTAQTRRRPFRSRPRQRRARAGRILRDRIHESESSGLRRRDPARWFVEYLFTN